MQEKVNSIESTANNAPLSVDEEQTAAIEALQTKTFLDKLRNFALTLMLLMISLGQWNDTKDVILSAYEEVISRWTNTLEYSKISSLRIGYSSAYVESLLGDPQVVKVSKLSEETKFSYYSSPKYLLTTAMKNDRLSGFSILSLKNNFHAPIIYLDKDLNKGFLDSYLPTQDNFVTDMGNLDYFIETYELNHSAMFYDLALGVVNVGNITNELKTEIRNVNDNLNKGEDMPLNQLSISGKITPNYYSVSELPVDVMFESMLSRFEMATLFNY